MKQIISQLIDDFQERELPHLTRRELTLPILAGKAAVVVGMRRTGKTCYCQQQMQQLLGQGLIKEKILYINFEDDRLLDFKVNDFQTILDQYYGKYPDFRNSPCHFFFDEIQRIDNWEMFIRRLLDTENVQLYLTGSSSKLLSRDIATSLRGRSLPTEMFPFNFKEFLRHNQLFKAPPTTFGTKTVSVLRKAARDYLAVGGFPEVQKLDPALRVTVLQGYIDSVLLRDVVERYNIANITVLKYLVRHIMNAPGGKFSVNKFYNTMRSMQVKCTKNSLYKYLDYLTDAYLFYRVPIHSRSEKARLVNPAKIYTIDTGLLQAMTFRNSADNGPLLENLVFMQLRRLGFSLEFVNDKAGYETDFIAKHPITGETKLIQVCWDITDHKTMAREVRGVQSAMEALNINEGVIVTWDDEDSSVDNICVIPVWKWLLE